MNKSQIKKAENHLAKADPIMAKLIAKQEVKSFGEKKDYFTALSRSIIGQQVSVAAARAIWGRFEDATKLKPINTLELSEKDMKAIGLSRQKQGYIRDLAQHFADNPKIYNHLETQTDEQVIEELTEIRGIGEWTAQMFLIGTLSREDVFAPDDLGLQNAIKANYKMNEIPKRKELIKFAEQWAPYRTVASLHLWHSLDNTPN